MIPGVLISGKYEGDRGDLVGGSRWRDGYWTLEIARALKTGSKYDKDFVPGKTDLHVGRGVRPRADAPQPPPAPGARRHPGIIGSVSVSE